jgi:hypothetical protein
LWKFWEVKRWEKIIQSDTSKPAKEEKKEETDEKVLVDVYLIQSHSFAESMYHSAERWIAELIDILDYLRKNNITFKEGETFFESNEIRGKMILKDNTLTFKSHKMKIDYNEVITWLWRPAK